MLIEKSVNISTKHTRAHSAEPNIRRASLTLHHCCSIMHHKTSSSQFSSRSHFIEKGNEKHGASEVKQSWHSAMSQSCEEKTSFYFMFRCRFQLEVKNKKLSNQTGRNALSERRRAAAALRKMKWNARPALTWTQTLPAKLERQRSEGQTRIRLLCFRQTMNN